MHARAAPTETPAAEGAPGGLSEGRLLKSEPKCRIWSGRLPDGTAAVVKMYRHRGPAGTLRGAALRFRAEREHAALGRLERCGVPCSRPLFWRRGYARAHGFYEILATREIPRAAPLNARLSRAGAAPEAADFRALFEAVDRMHRHGVYHGALSPKNILVGPAADGPPRLFLIDMARAKLFPGSIRGKRIARCDLLQLVVKLERHLGFGACRPFLGACGLGAPATETLYAEARRWGRMSRSRKTAQARLALEIFLAASAARLALALRPAPSGRPG